MNFLQTARLAMRSLALHKFRAVLTSLGVIIGVAAVIAMMSINEGARKETLEQIRILGVNNIRVKSIKPVAADRKQQDQQNQNWILRYGLTRKELDHFKELSPDIETVVPLREIRQDVWSADIKTDIRVIGTTPDLFKVLRFTAEEGRLLTDLDLEEGRPVCVVGAEARRKLFRTKSWRGQQVRVGGQYFMVVGIADEKPIKSGGPVQVANLNNLVYVPYSAMMKDFGATSVKRSSGSMEAIRVEVDEAIVAVAREEAIIPVGRILERAVSRTHPQNDYEIVVPLELLRQSQKTQRTFAIVMISIAALSLLVGGIGIMNIMLANVAERKKEIGTRRALGARKRDIRRQFLMESVVLSCLGGLVGLGFGIGGAHVIQSAAGWQTAVPPIAIIIAFSVAATTGIVFGTFPAVKAAGLDPIEALRTE
ncbi:MAG TPA: ABC transporter permease [Planctomycetota bacterium]|nr:ABC transporter permease [Planctomycetota bacterium]